MKRKQRILFLICITVFLTIGFPSCDSDYAAFRDIVSVDIFDPITRKMLETPASTSSDSISLIIFIEIVEFSFNYILIPRTMNEAWATSPLLPWMANEITDIRVYCDQSIYGIAPGENIALELGFGFYTSQKLPLAEYLELLPGKGEDYYGGLELIHVFFNSKPPTGFYTFTVEMEDNNGHILISTAPTLEWL